MNILTHIKRGKPIGKAPKYFHRKVAGTRIWVKFVMLKTKLTDLNCETLMAGMEPIHTITNFNCLSWYYLVIICSNFHVSISYKGVFLFTYQLVIVLYIVQKHQWLILCFTLEYHRYALNIRQFFLIQNFPIQVLSIFLISIVRIFWNQQKIVIKWKPDPTKRKNER